MPSPDSYCASSQTNNFFFSGFPPQRHSRVIVIAPRYAIWPPKKNRWVCSPPNQTSSIEGAQRFGASSRLSSGHDEHPAQFACSALLQPFEPPLTPLERRARRFTASIPRDVASAASRVSGLAARGTTPHSCSRLSTSRGPFCAASLLLYALLLRQRNPLPSLTRFASASSAAAASCPRASCSALSKHPHRKRIALLLSRVANRCHHHHHHHPPWPGNPTRSP